MRGPVLFVSHDATRTGAPIALLNLLKFLKHRGEPPFEVLLRSGGALAESFEALASVSYWPEPSVPPPLEQGAVANVLRRLATLTGLRRSPRRSLERRKAALLAHFRTREFALIYSNTITNGSVLGALRPLGIPVISHVHELDYWMSHRVDRRDLELARDCTDLFIAASGAVAHTLTSKLGVPESKIATVYESIQILGPSEDGLRRHARARWKIPEHAFVVGGAGTMDWRKGIDLLAPLAREVERQQPQSEVHWLWVGGESDGPDAGKLRHDFRRAGLETRLHLTGVLEDPREAFAGLDAFLVLSREDPFPLVMLEAASAGLPILCFDKAGGAPEFVRQDAGFIVAYLDLHTMASRILELQAAPSVRHAFGQVALERVIADHDVRDVAPKILNLIERTAAGSRA